MISCARSSSSARDPVKTTDAGFTCPFSIKTHEGLKAHLSHPHRKALVLLVIRASSRFTSFLSSFFATFPSLDPVSLNIHSTIRVFLDFRGSRCIYTLPSISKTSAFLSELQFQLSTTWLPSPPSLSPWPVS